MSFVDVPNAQAPSFLDVGQFTNWLLAKKWTSDDLSDPNIYTASIALTAALTLNANATSRCAAATEAIHLITGSIRSDGGISWSSTYPSHGFYAYWCSRALLLLTHSEISMPGDEVAQIASTLDSLRSWAEGTVHHQFSYATIKDLDNFDALQLAYGLATLDWIDSAEGRPPNRTLIQHGLQVFFDSQMHDGMWPKGLPLFHGSGGSVYPFAIEVLTNLLRLGSRPTNPHLAAVSSEFFRPHLERLLNTFEWVESHYIYGENANGWRSNHLLPGPVPQAWSTAAVLAFLNGLETLIAELQTAEVLNKFGARAERIQRRFDLNEENWTSLGDSETRVGSSNVSLKRFLFENVVAKHLAVGGDRPWALILSGPPGTAKTSLARAIASAIGWPLLEVTTGDFLSRGADLAVSQARSIFRDLEQVRDIVVFIDEVEEFVRDRSNVTLERDARLWTTAMLTMLQSLRDRESVMLILATNYIDYLDSAIKRPGRFDVVAFVLPPSVDQKLAALSAAFEGEPVEAEVRELLDGLRRKSSVIERLTYLEWRGVIEELVAQANELGSPWSGSDVLLNANGLLVDLEKSMTISKDEWAKWEDRSSYAK